MIKFYACDHCGTPTTPHDAAVSPACSTCGKPWRGVPRLPVDLPAIRARAGEALESGSEELLRKVVAEDVPAMFSLIGELLRATLALNGTCTCKVLRVRTRKVGPCPHYRAAAAMKRAGVEPQQQEQYRQQMDRRIP